MDFLDAGNPWFWAALALAYLLAEILVGTYFFLSAAIALALVALAVLFLGPELAREVIWFLIGAGAFTWIGITLLLRRTRWLKASEPVEARSDPNEY